MSKRSKDHSYNNNKDIYFDIQAIHDTLQEMFKGEVDPSSSLYLAAVLQYVATEIIEISIKDKNRQNGEKLSVTIDDINKSHTRR
ncbi:hypothetical protein CEXT_375101 [Caerostris extrusa]|uniref:Histone H2A n=1 Tax=Caerostris extrusa TaxID=172846 RepID=A0AAV4UAS0_CAEEX|nr:hypothetical protein CEXT_375101 [Caerostris extrusa]